MARSTKKTVEELENKFLEAVEQNSAPRCPACFSLRKLALELGVTEGRVRSTQRSLLKAGMLRTEPRFAPDGGQLANGYRLTVAGRSRLKSSCYTINSQDNTRETVEASALI